MKQNSHSSTSVIKLPWLAVLAAVLLIAGNVRAVTYTNTVSGLWSAAGSWTGGSTPPSTGGAADAIILFQPTTTFNSTNDLGAFLLNQLWFNSAASRFMTNTAAGGNSLIFTNSGALITNSIASTNVINSAITLGTNITIGAVANGLIIISSNITESVAGSSLTSVGSGTLFLQASNSYSGGTVLTGGTINYSTNNPLGSGAISVTGNATMGANTNATAINVIAILTNNLSVASGVTLTLNESGINAATTYGGVLSSADATAVIYKTHSGSLSQNNHTRFTNLNNSFSGIVKLGTTPNNTYLSFASISDSARIEGGGTSCAFAVDATASSPITFNTRYVLITNSLDAKIQNNSTVPLVINTDLAASNTTAQTLQLGASNFVANTFAGLIANSPFGGAIGVSKYVNIAGLWILSNTNNSYTGQTTINGGTLQINSIADYGVNCALGKGTSPVTISIAGNGGNSGLFYAGGAASSNRKFQFNSGGNATINNNGTGALTLTANPFNATNGLVAAGAVFLGGTYSGGVNEIQGALLNNATTSGTTLTKSADSSIWKLSGTNSYLGTTAINGGTLLINGDSSAVTNTVTVANGASLGGTGTLGGRVTNNAFGTILPGGGNTVGVLTLTNRLGNSGYIAFDLTSPASAGTTYDQINGGGTLAVTLGGTPFVQINATTGVLTNGTYNLITNTASIAGGQFVFLNGQTNQTIGASTLTLATSASGLVLTVSADVAYPTNTLVWRGTTGGIWDINTSTNWVSGGATTVYNNGANVFFDDSASNFTVSGTNLSPASVVFNNTTAYTVSASTNTIGGSGSLAKFGSGTLTLNGTNTYSGGTVLGGGTLTYTADAVLGASRSRNLTFTGNASLTGFNGSSSLNQLSVSSGATATINLTGNITFPSTTGAGTIIGTGQAGTSTTLNLGDASGFTGTIKNIDTYQGGMVSFSKLSDTGNLQLGGTSSDSNQRVIFQLTGGAAPLTLNSSQIQLLNAGGNNNRGYKLQNDNGTPANKWVIKTDLVNNVLGRLVEFTLGGSNTGSNEFAGVIGNGANAVALIKQDAGKWILSSSNTFTGGVVINGGTLSVGTFNDTSVAGPLGQSQLQLGGTFGGGTGAIADGSGTLEYTGSGNTTTRTVKIGDGVAAANTGAGSILNNGSGALNFSAANFNPTIASVTGTRTLTLGGASTDANTIQGIIQDNVAGTGKINLTKSGLGIWGLSGANTYSGATTVSGGTLLINGNSSAANGTVTVASGATLGGLGVIGGTVTNKLGGHLAPGAGSGVAGTLTLTNGLQLASGSYLSFVITNSSAGAYSQVAVTNGAFAINGTVNVQLIAATNQIPVGTYTLITNFVARGNNSGQAVFYQTGTTNWTIGGSTLMLGTNANSVYLTVSGAAANMTNSPLYWQGSANTVWDTNSLNWISAPTYADGAAVIFDDSATSFTVTSGAFTPSPGSVTVSNTTAYTMSAAIQGTAALTKVNTGTLTLSGANTYNGGTTVSAGTLALSGSGSLLNSSVTVSAGTFTEAATATIGGATASLAFYGTSVTLSNANTYGGGTTWGNPASSVAGGILALGNNQALGTGALTNRNNNATTPANSIQSTDSTARTITNAITIAGSGIFFNTAGTGDLTFSGSVDLGSVSSPNRTFNVGNNFTTLSGVISGSGATLTKTGAGTLTLSGTNTYTGSTTIDAVLSINSITNVGGGASALGAPTTVANGMINIGSTSYGQLKYTGGSTTTDRILNLVSATTQWGQIDQSGTGLLKFTGFVTNSGTGKNFELYGSTAGIGELAGGINNGANASAVLALNKYGTGTWVLSGANNYKGPTLVSAGTLLVNGNSSAATNVVTVATNATFGGTGTVGGVVRYQSGSLAAFTVTPTAANAYSNTTYMTFTNAAFLTNVTVKVDLGTALGNGTYVLATNYVSFTTNGTLTFATNSGTLGSGGSGSITNTGKTLVLTVGGVGPVGPVSNYLALASVPSQTNGYKDSVYFTATVQTNGATATNAPGSVIFYYSTYGTNALVAFSTNALVLGTTNSLNLTTITNLPRGTNLIRAEYAGNGTYLGWTNSLIQTVTNHPPVANLMTVSRSAGSSLLIALSDLATNWSDAIDGDTVGLTSVTNPSTNGMTWQALNWITNSGVIATTNFAFLGYTNNLDVNDRISYVVTDSFGGTTTGFIQITVNANPFTGQQSINYTNASPTLTFYGVPGYSYTVQRSLALPATWVDLTNYPTTFTATNVIMQVTDTNNPEAYYRLKSP